MQIGVCTLIYRTSGMYERVITELKTQYLNPMVMCCEKKVKNDAKRPEVGSLDCHLETVQTTVKSEAGI